MFHNANLNNLGNILQRNLRAERARECIFKAFGGTILKVPTQQQPWWCLCEFHFMYRSAHKNSGYVTDAWQKLARLAIDKVQYNTKNYGN